MVRVWVPGLKPAVVKWKAPKSLFEVVPTTTPSTSSVNVPVGNGMMS